MTYEWLGQQDATLWCAEGSGSPLQVGALCLFEAGPLRDGDGRLRTADLRRHMEAALEHAPRLRQVLVTPPWGLGRPAWVDDRRFDLDRHLHNVTLASPGGPAELREFARELLATPLPRDHPMWGCWLVDGVENGRVAVLLKFSHLVVDGVALLTFALSLLDDHPRSVPNTPEGGWHPSGTPAMPRLTGAALLESTRRRVGLVADVAGAIRRPDRLVGSTARTVQAAREMLVPAPRLPMTAPAGSRWDFAWRRLPLEALTTVARAHGATLNDVLLTLTAHAVTAGLARAGVPTGGRNPRALVPVSTHDGDSGLANSFSFLLVDLPAGERSPAATVDAVHAATKRAKATGQAELGAMAFRIENVIPPGLLRVVAPPALRRQPFANLAVTNLPGSPVPLYLLGSRMLEVYPFITLTGNFGLIVGALSHEDALGISVTANPDLGIDAEAFVRDMESAARGLTGGAGDPGRRLSSSMG